MVNPTPNDLERYLETRNFKVVFSGKNYVMYDGARYVMIPKDVSEIKPTHLDEILNAARISKGEFESEFES